MAKRFAVAFAAVLFMALASAAQSAKQPGTAESSLMSAKPVTISGAVGADGKTFATANGKIVWAVANPEALLDNIGEHVSIRALIDAAKHEIQVTAVRIDPTAGARLHDAAFRR